MANEPKTKLGRRLLALREAAMAEDAAIDCPPPSEAGPWRVDASGEGVYSEDFTHDVGLSIGGDFASRRQKRMYAEWLASALNSLSANTGG